MADDKNPDDNQVKLYSVLVDQLQKYNTIIWQIPTAIMAANVLALDKLSSTPAFLLAVSIFNAALIFAFYKMVTQQRAIIDASRSAENELRKIWPAFIPNFKPSKFRSPGLFVWTLGLLNLCLFIYSVLRICK